MNSMLSGFGSKWKRWGLPISIISAGIVTAWGLSRTDFFSPKHLLLILLITLLVFATSRR